MKYLDTKRSENLTRLLKYYLIFVKIITIIGLVAGFVATIYAMVTTYNELAYDLNIDAGNVIMLYLGCYILGAAATIVVTQVLMTATKILFKAVIAWTESAEYNIAHIKAIHYDGNFIQTNNESPN